ncbi:MAG: hypothetical protein RIC30_04795 [Marinoscillum sp.]|uniref:hypothetical protein n=1 Tax=Marinoscillum sp. TaxID=2024838 RepID=UPI0032FB1394
MKTSTSALLLIFLTSCGAIDGPAADDMPRPRTEFINCFCDEYNSTTEWVYCTPVNVNLTGLPIESAVMNYSVRITRGGDILEAELYDINGQQAIPLTRVESVIGYVMHTRKTENIAGYLQDHEKELVIRFRVNREGAVGYMSNGSGIELTYKN